MHLDLLPFLESPIDRTPLNLIVGEVRGDRVVAGTLVSASGDRFTIREGIPRFANDRDAATVRSFGDEWNFFNFTDFKINWLTHTVRNTFGSVEYFRDKVVVDCGAGSGAQSRWMAESGARRVIALELSHSVDGVMRANLSHLENVDIIQCNISTPPLRPDSLTDLVLCHNVIHHTQSVERTAQALFRIVRPGGEFVFNCYMRNDKGLLRKIRWSFYRFLRAILSGAPERVLRSYAWSMSRLVQLPVLGRALTLSCAAVSGDVPPGPDQKKRRVLQTYLNTYDAYGSHTYQHHLSEHELIGLVRALQPDMKYVYNLDEYFRRPQPIGIAIRIRKTIPSSVGYVVGS